MRGAWLKSLFWILLVASAATMAALSCIGTKLAPHGAVDLELCAFELPCRPDCRTILDAWKDHHDVARRALQLDFLFLLLYPALFCVGLLLVAERVPNTQRRSTRLLAWLTLVAAPLDATENFYLLRFLDTHAQADALVAGWVAAIKFAILLVTVGWLVVASLRTWIGATAALP